MADSRSSRHSPPVAPASPAQPPEAAAWYRQHAVVAASGALAIVAVLFAVLSELGAPFVAVLGAPLLGAAVYYLSMRPAMRRRRVLRAPFPGEWRRVLGRHVRYYNALVPEEREGFEREVAVFLTEHQITGVGTSVTEGVKALVAASAVMLLFGRPGWEWDNLPEILIYPKTFDDTFSTRCSYSASFAGRVVPQNAVVLSKPDLLRSFRNGSAYHVALHEFAHVLDMEDGRFDGIPRGLGARMRDQWARVIARELERVQKGQSALDEYAGTDEVELFAVAVEYFFQAPRVLHKSHAELYAMLASFLNQEPAART